MRYRRKRGRVGRRRKSYGRRKSRRRRGYLIARGGIRL